jgi:hypothetical protein
MEVPIGFEPMCKRFAIVCVAAPPQHRHLVCISIMFYNEKIKLRILKTSILHIFELPGRFTLPSNFHLPLMNETYFIDK